MLHRVNRLIVIIGIISTALLVLPGCGMPPRGYVAREWTGTMRELDINPIFPPREDVQVGDVYLVNQTSNASCSKGHVAKNDYMKMGLWVGSLPINDTVSNFYDKRSSFPPTPDAVKTEINAKDNDYHQIPQAAYCTEDTFLKGDNHRLRMVGFPSFFAHSYSSGDLSALVPIETISLAIGVSFSQAKSINVSVPVAESYGLPAPMLLEKITVKKGDTRVIKPEAFGVQDLALLHPSQNEDSSKDFFLVVDSEVFYARVIDVGVEFSQNIGASARGSLITPITSTQKKPATDGSAPPTVPAKDNKSTTGGDASPTPALPTASDPSNPFNIHGDAPSDIEARLNKKDELKVPGGSVQFIGHSDYGVSMRRLYERPIAIGYRGFLIKVNAKDGTVENLGVVNSSTVQGIHLEGIEEIR